MKTSAKKNEKKFELSENFSYKVVALFIALILWLTILNRREHIQEIDLVLSFALNSKQRVVAQSAETLHLSLVGTRSNFRKFAEEFKQKSFVIDLSRRGYGGMDLEIPIHNLELPTGMKLKQLNPHVIHVEVEEIKEGQ